MTDTIKLSDRLDLRPGGQGWTRLTVDGEAYCTVDDAFRDALIEACNPPRYDLPAGVIHGSDGKFYAPGDVVRTLPDEMWTTHWASGNKRHKRNDLDTCVSYWYEVRPTAANPLKPLPEHTFPLPDGTLACFRRDAAKLREAGARVLHTDDGAEVDPPSNHRYPDEVLRVEFPAPPKTERVLLHELIGRTKPDANEPVDSWVYDTLQGHGTAFWVGGSSRFVLDTDGLVEVCAVDGAA